MARPRYLIIAIAIATLVVLTGCRDREPPPPAPAPATTRVTPPTPKPRTVRVAPEWQSRVPPIDAADVPATLRNADEALSRGQLEQGSGPGPGALELYLAVLAIEPANEPAQSGIQSTLDALLERGRLAMRAGRIGDAERIDLIVRSLIANHQDLEVYRRSLKAARTAAHLVEKANAAGARGRLVVPKGRSAADYLAQASRAFDDFEPAAASLQRWNRVLLDQAWKAARAEDFLLAEQRLRESARMQPRGGDARVMGLRVIEWRQARTTALLAAGNRAVDKLQLDLADRLLAHAAKLAAQPVGPEALRHRIYLARHYGPFKPGEIFSDRLRKAGRGPEMIVLPHGKFAMGALQGDPQARPDELPAHEVTFARGFAMARNETTVAEFQRFVAATRYQSKATRAGRSTVYDEKGGVFSEHEGVDWRRDHVGRIASGALPVVHVALQDALAYARWLSAQTGKRYRLPSEAEFEYALRAGSATPFPWGEGRPLTVIGNLAGAGDVSRSGRRWGNAIPGYRDAFWGPALVRNFPAEKFSTYDLIGNVSEWTLDCWHEGYQRAPNDGSAWVNPGCPQRVVRGASWASSLDQARSAARLPMDADTSTARLGFRLVREI